MYINEIVSELNKNGIKTYEVVNPNYGELTDGSIDLGENYYLQVGRDYICLNQSSGVGKNFTVRQVATFEFEQNLSGQWGDLFFHIRDCLDHRKLKKKK